MCPSQIVEKRYDLHVHSACSDGSFTPLELLYMAQERGLSGLSITDHDTFAAYDEAFLKLADQLKMTVVIGIEVSSLHLKKSVHVLGYDFDLQSKSFIGFIKNLQEKRYVRNLQILEKLKAKHIYIAQEELYPETEKHALKGRPQIADLVVKKRPDLNFQAAFDLYLKEGASCYVSANKCTTSEVIDQIHKAQGKAILAHPHQVKDRRQIKALLTLDFDGIEAYYGRLPPNREKEWINAAQSKNWLITGGSDFHGHSRVNVPLGSSWVGKKDLDLLLKKK